MFFAWRPKRIEKNQRYFQGTVLGGRPDLAVVKTDGKAVPDPHDRIRICFRAS